MKRLRIPNKDVQLDADEIAVTQTRQFQRLFDLKQLGLAYLVYPAASHTRGHHSIRCLHEAEKILKALREKQPEIVTGHASKLVRMTALLHDIGHAAYSHTLEDEHLVLEKHDRKERLEIALELLKSEVASEQTKALIDEAKPILYAISSKDENDKDWKSDIVGNTVCADLLAYIATDADYTGIVKKPGHYRIYEYFQLVKISERYRVCIKLTKGGLRTDIVSAIMDLLDMRYALTERVLFHHGKCVASGMLARAARLCGLPGNISPRLLRDLEPELLANPSSDVFLTLGFSTLEEAKEFFDVEDIAAMASDERDAAKRFLSRALEMTLLRMADERFINFLERLALRKQTEEANGALRLIAGLRSRRLYKRTFKVGQTGRNNWDTEHVAPGKFCHNWRDGAKVEQMLRVVENENNLPIGSLVLWCPEGDAGMKLVKALVVWDAVDEPDQLCEPALLRDVSALLFPSVRARVKMIEDQYNDLWTFWVAIERSYIQQAVGVVRSLERHLGNIKCDSVFERTYLYNPENFPDYQQQVEHREHVVAAFNTTLPEIEARIYDQASADGNYHEDEATILSVIAQVADEKVITRRIEPREADSKQPSLFETDAE